MSLNIIYDINTNIEAYCLNNDDYVLISMHMSDRTCHVGCQLRE